MRPIFLALLALVFTVQAVHLHMNHEATVDLPNGSVYIISNNGGYLRVCLNCGGLAAYPASVENFYPGDNSFVWTL